MADNENKDVEDMMAILAQMEEKAKNMERLVVLRRQEREQMEKENEAIQKQLDCMKQAMDEEDEENGRLDNNESKWNTHSMLSREEVKFKTFGYKTL